MPRFEQDPRSYKTFTAFCNSKAILEQESVYRRPDDSIGDLSLNVRLDILIGYLDSLGSHSEMPLCACKGVVSKLNLRWGAKNFFC